MKLIDEIIEYLHYHPQSKRHDIEAYVGDQASTATVKRLLTAGIDAGMIVSSGNNRATVYSITSKAHLLRTIDLDSYYAVDADHRSVQLGYNFELIRHELPKVELFTEDECAKLNECRQLFDAHMKDITPGIYNRELERLAIDLSWKSAQIEGS